MQTFFLISTVRVMPAWVLRGPEDQEKAIHYSAKCKFKGDSDLALAICPRTSFTLCPEQLVEGTTRIATYKTSGKQKVGAGLSRYHAFVNKRTRALFSQVFKIMISVCQ